VVEGGRGRDYVEPSREPPARAGLVAPTTRGGRRREHGRSRRRLRRGRAEFARYKEDVQKRGKPFFPYAMFHDTVMSLVVVLVIVALACIWKWTTPGDHTGTGPAGSAALQRQGRPRDDELRAAPDWYFYFLFYLLRIFKWPTR
jgi:quinol-cytochrome oxidoreductase complex cytochrome b subunit